MSEQPWLDITAYAELLGVPRTWVRDKVTAREIKHTRVGKHVRFSPDDRAKNAAMWAQEPINTPAPVVVIRPGGIRRRRPAA